MNPVALARMRRAFREDAPSRVEIAAARARYEATVARAPAPSVGSLLRWGLAGAAVGVLTMLLLGAPARPAPAIAAEPSAPSRAAAPPAVTAETVRPREIAPQPPRAERPVAPRRERPRAAAAPPVPAPSASAAAVSAAAPPRSELGHAARWLSIGRGTEATPIVVGLDKDAAAP